ncbi:hypothetical protein OsJ_26528 [Oryza sativa Japonica Group]|uniref:Uncharacterized protein n=1 Tax=Oryza sativa subsp. japonica TaxID=39947 RepID=B9FZR9_ORYSJ|nr:hypothetical protein OsJ_26528 [Oryza sativa Japonica Group]
MGTLDLPLTLSLPLLPRRRRFPNSGSGGEQLAADAPSKPQEDVDLRCTLRGMPASAARRFCTGLDRRRPSPRGFRGEQHRSPLDWAGVFRYQCLSAHGPRPAIVPTATFGAHSVGCVPKVIRTCGPLSW